ncbi:MAG: hypothetical protein KF832_24070 [Caldilineaceae bacterium]|nr:hypothetical protein [Caldilineaceae bacterium]
MDKVITTTFMIIASIITSVMVFNAVFPAITRSRDALTIMRGRMDERIKSQISIIHATGELDQQAMWQDSNANEMFDVFVWVKNVGDLRITAVDQMDLFFGPEGNFARIPHVSDAGGTYPYWEWTVENDTYWNPTATLKITVHYASILPSQRYFLKVVLPNGLSNDYYFSM